MLIRSGCHMQMLKAWTGPGGEAGALSLMLDLGPYVNTSTPAVQSSFSVERAHMLFRSLGLRHLTVVDAHNRVKGILTRKVRLLLFAWHHFIPQQVKTKH